MKPAEDGGAQWVKHSYFLYQAFYRNIGLHFSGSQVKNGVPQTQGEVKPNKSSAKNPDSLLGRHLFVFYPRQTDAPLLNFAP